MLGYTHSLVSFPKGLNLYGEGVLRVCCGCHWFKCVPIDVIEGSGVIDCDVLIACPWPVLVCGYPWSQFMLRLKKPSLVEVSCGEGLYEPCPFLRCFARGLFLAWELEFASPSFAREDPGF